MCIRDSPTCRVSRHCIGESNRILLFPLYSSAYVYIHVRISLGWMLNFYFTLCSNCNTYTTRKCNECDSSRCWLIRPPTPYMLHVHVHIIARPFLTVPSSSLHLVARHRHWPSPKVLTRRFVFQKPQPYMYHWCMYPHHRRCHSPPSPLKKHYR